MPAANTDKPASVSFEVMPAAQLYAALEGTGTAPPSHVLEPLPFYYRVNMFAVEGQPESRTFVVATLHGASGAKMVGLAELDTNPQNSSELWLFYVAVAPAYRGRRIGANLLAGVIELAQQRGQSLAVSYPTELSKEQGFQQHLEAALNASGVPWSQSH